MTVEGLFHDGAGALIEVGTAGIALESHLTWCFKEILITGGS